MKRVLKRVLSLLLVLTLCCSNVVNIYADTPGNSAAGRVPVPHPGGGGGGVRTKPRQSLLITDFE